MVMVIGLKSGKEFLVEDKSYIVYPENQIIHIYTSIDKKRRITVNHLDIEYFDEVNSEEKEDYLVKMASVFVEPETAGVDYV